MATRHGSLSALASFCCSILRTPSFSNPNPDATGIFCATQGHQRQVYLLHHRRVHMAQRQHCRVGDLGQGTTHWTLTLTLALILILILILIGFGTHPT